MPPTVPSQLKRDEDVETGAGSTFGGSFYAAIRSAAADRFASV